VRREEGRMEDGGMEDGGMEEGRKGIDKRKKGNIKFPFFHISRLTSHLN
jgi:hypothetical protein